mgnify:CR=1 FL=1
MKLLSLSAIIIFSTCTFSAAQKKVILDTDPSADPDDVGCMAMLHYMATIGECEILAVINSTHYKQSSLSISAINTFYNRKAIPVGDYKGYSKKIEAPETNYDYHLARVYPRNIHSWKEALDGVSLYREILASAEDSSITVVIIGTMHNFYDLLQSEGDKFSELDGVQLVEKKVAQVVTMGGNFIDGQGYDRTNWGGSDLLCEYTDWSCLNQERNEMCRYVIEHCPSPFVASGWEVGCGDYYNANFGNVMTGQSLRKLDTTHILRRSYEYHFVTRGETEDISRHSNDQCALHYAIRGESNNYIAYTNGKITLSESGVCNWDESLNNQQGFIQKNRHKDSIASEIEELMMMTPAEVDMTPPAKPTNLVVDTTSGKISWEASIDKTKGSWVVGYNFYLDDKLFTTAYGTQLVLQDELQPGVELELRALNSAEIESESSWLTVE